MVIALNRLFIHSVNVVCVKRRLRLGTIGVNLHPALLHEKKWRQSGDKILNRWSFLVVTGSLTLCFLCKCLFSRRAESARRAQ